MPWYVPWSESIKKRACRYLLQRYLGQFLEEKLTLDQLSVDLYNGTGTVADVSLDVQALNELGDQQNWPVELVDGYIDNISVSIPWSALLSEASYVEVQGLTVTVQPKQRDENGTSMFESMWSSMTSSMQLAQECLRQESGSVQDSSTPPEGLELFAQTIDSILSRVKVRFVDTLIRMEHVPKNSTSGVAIEINIKNMEYLDEAGNDPPVEETTEITGQEHTKTYVVSSFTTKKFYLEGVTLSTDEFPSKSRTFSRSVTQLQIAPYHKSDTDIVKSLMEELNIKDVRMTSCKNSGSSDSDPQIISDNEFHDTESSQSSEDKHDMVQMNEQSNEHESVLFAKLTGRQEIRLRLKQSESVSGPKAAIEVTLGSLTTFLSPRQVQVLVELASGLASPDMEDNSNIAPKQRCVEKPMDKADYQRVEHELQQHLHPLVHLQTTGLQHTQGWSTASLDDSDDADDAEFQPMRNVSAGLSDSVLSVTSSMDSSIASSASSQTSSRVTNSTRPLPSRPKRRDLESPTDVWQLELRAASLALILLHDDLLTVNAEGAVALSSIRHAAHTAHSFFNNLGIFAVAGYGNKDFENASKVFEKACTLNHIRLLAAPIHLECNQKSTTYTTCMSGQITAARLELLECLMPEAEIINAKMKKKTNESQKREMYRIELLTFESDLNSSPQHNLGSKPSFKMVFKHSERPYRQFQGKKIPFPKTDVSFYLESCKSEFDLTICDRLCALLNPTPLCSPSPTTDISLHRAAVFNATNESPASEYKYDIKIECPQCIIKMRFPIPDMRPLHDMQRSPWWQRNIRPDYVTLRLEEASLTISLHSRQPATRMQLTAKVVHAYYTEADTDILIPIGKAACDEKAGYYSDNSNWPCMVILVYPLQTLGGELDESSGADSEPHCFDGLTASRIPSPFSSKRIVHESDTPHAKQQDIENGEELVIPGDSQEMSEFIEFATKSARIQIEVTFPCLSLQLISKHMYETLYNRICTDILLWEPSAPRSNIMTGYDIPATDLRESIYPAFSMCKSGIQYDSESEDSEEEGVYYSVYENRQRQKRKQALSIPPGQSTLALTFNIVKGLLAMYTPVRDSSTNVMPGQHGELVLTCDNASIFTVSGYRGNIDLGYVCVQSKLASLYHCGLLTTPSQSPPLREVGNTLPRHLQLTIYGSEEGVKRGSPQPRSLDMVKVAIRIQANHETHHMKMVRVACGINGATLHHRACPDPQSWFSEIQDMFNVDDYDVPGYEPPGVLVEFHLHLWSCAIDYRPIYLPLRAVLTMGNFSMSCNLVAQTHTSTLRFIAEDCCLLLSNRCSVNTIDLRKDYVCVVDLGLFELSVRYSDKARGNNPQVDLRVSNNVLHVRTCSDSGRALMQLITYLATDGDLIPVGEPPITANPISNTRRASAISSTGSDTGICASEVLLNVEPPQQICDLSKSQHQHVITVLDEAMQEEAKIDTNIHDDYGLPPVGVEVFFFPDEALQETGFVENTKALPQVAKDLGDMNYVPPPLPPRNSDTDDEFCILGEEVGTGFLPKHGLPEIRWLIKDPLRIIDNHFTVPLSKTDLLKAPKHFPVAVLRYTLCEMTLIWHMYGGSDFRPNINTQDKKTVNFSLDTKQDLSDYNNVSRDIPGDTVSFNKSEPNTVKFSTPQKVNTNSSKWISQGGPGRNHDVLMELQLNKVRFIHEVYPENTKQASRQVLLVSEVEIRDRLASSHINKFLYQYSSESRPKQTHANMVVIKAVHLRPDPKIKAQECCLKISLLPLRLNIDQDSLLFLIDFFRELSGAPNSLDDDSTNTKPTSQTASKHNTPTHQPPVMTVNYPLQNNTSVTESIVDQQEAQLLVSENLILLAGNLPPPVEEKSFRPVNESCEESPPIYFRNVVFSPDVPIRLDYQGKRVDMSHPGGALAGLLMGLGQLNCSELRLRRLNHRHGLLGFDKLVSYALHKWLTDIKKNQLPSLLGGVGPIHALVQLFQGIRDLFWLPIEQYQKDGRIVRGLQRGANSFTTSTAMAALELTSRIIHLIQLTAETAYDMVSPGPSVRRRLHGKKGKRKRYNQPQDIREGMANAYCLVKEGLGETANTLVRVASQEHEQKGYSGAVGGVLRQIPPTVVKPIILATEATNNVLGGMVSQLVPDVRREASQKWRSDDS